MVVGPLALAAFGYFIVWVADRNVRHQQRLIEESTPVDAVVIDSRVGTTTPGRDNSMNAKSAYVTFEYEYGDETYQSTHLRPGGTRFGSASGTTARRRANRYDVGESVTAHVPESDPRMGFLEKTTSSRGHLVMRLIGWSVTAVGVLVAIVLLVL
jgi:hypothetical protein